MARKTVTVNDIATQTHIWASLVKEHKKADDVVALFQGWFNTGIPTGIAITYGDSIESFDEAFAAAEAEERKAWRAVSRAARRLIELSERFQAANQPLGV